MIDIKQIIDITTISSLIVYLISRAVIFDSPRRWVYLRYPPLYVRGYVDKDYTQYVKRDGKYTHIDIIKQEYLQNNDIQGHAQADRLIRKPSFIGRLLQCGVCLSFWIAPIIAVSLGVYSVNDIAVCIAATCIIQRQIG